MRAHFADGSPIADSEDLTMENRLANQSILLVGCWDFTHVRVRLSKVHGRLSGLVPAGSLLHFRRSILRLDVVAAVFAEDAAFGRLRSRHRGVHCNLPLGFDYLLDF